ncbi:hypothetical protein [Marinifilum sp.]|uniref:hypothetical protein n=1 Tax=Marinifilum sp. TaxID=2033137 RepID=UPI003BA8493D
MYNCKADTGCDDLKVFFLRKGVEAKQKESGKIVMGYKMGFPVKFRSLEQEAGFYSQLSMC